MLKARWLLSSAIILGGVTQAQAGFIFNFDERGAFSYNLVTASGTGPTVTGTGTIVGGFLNFTLPEAAYVTRDVGVSGPVEGEICNITACSDGLRLTAGSTTMLYFSETPMDQGAIADTGPFPGFAPTIFAFEAGTPDVNETFAFSETTGAGGPANTHVFIGQSDFLVPIPEPATIALLGTALVGLGAAFRRRRGCLGTGV